jgi:hypothetical protein
MWAAFVPTLLKISFALAVTGHGIDLGATQRCIGAGRCTELNPWLMRYENAVGFSAAKLGVASGTEIMVYEFSKQRRGLAIGVNFTIGGGFTGLGIRNERISR